MAPLIRRLRDSRRALGAVARNRALRTLELAFTWSIVSSWAYSIGIVVFAFEHGGARAAGIVGVLRWVSAAIVSPFAAIFGDRYARRRVMILSDLARVAAMGATAALAWWGVAPAVYVLAAVVSIAGTPFRPAEAALTPKLAQTPEELSAANVVASAIESIGIFVGPALAGSLLALADAAAVFAATAVGVAVSALLVASIRIAEEPARERTGEAVVDELAAGVRVLGRDRRVALLVGLFSAQTFVDGLLGVLIAVIAFRYLDAGAGAVGYLNAASGVGGVVGAVLAAGLIGRGRLAANFGLGVALFGIPLALVALSRSTVAALLLMGLLGIGNTLVDASGTTLLQRSAPDEVLARLFGVLESILLLTVGLGAITAPLLLHGVGIRGALVAAGGLLPLLVAAAWPMLRRIDRPPEVPDRFLRRLADNPIFAPLPEATLEHLARSLVETAYGPGEEIVREGDAGESFYIVDRGSVDVIADGRTLASLGSGDFFGEIALIRDVPRTATVRAREPVDLLSLARTDFVAAVTGHATSLGSAERFIGTRLGRARAATP